MQQSIGIDLGGSGNNNQAAPGLTIATKSSTGTTITGTLASVPNTTFRLEFFASPSLNGSGAAEGQTFLGYLNVTTSPDGNLTTGTFTANVSAVPTGLQYITATATRLDAGGNPTDTSQFSPLLVLPAKVTPVFTGLASPTIIYGTTSVMLSGHLAGNAGQQPVPAGETVTVTLNGVSQSAVLDGSDNFSTGFDTHALGASGSPYTLSYGYAGDNNFNSASDSSTALTVLKATPTFSAVGTTIIKDGTPSVTLSGTISDGSLIPTGSVTVTVDGISQLAAIGSSGSFSATFTTGSLNVGTHNITFTYGGDSNFLTASASGSLDDTYAVVVLLDQSHPKHPGSTLPIQITLATVSGQDVSSAAIAAIALGTAATTDTTDMVGTTDPSNVGTLIPAQAAGGSNPGNLFRYQGGTNPFYMYNLQIPSGLAAGTYRLYFSAQGDPLDHWVTFTVG